MKRSKELFWNILLHFFPVLGTIKLERLVNEPGNEMWRWGGGYNNYRKYFRIDIGSRGWRWTRDIDWMQEYFSRVYAHCAPDHQRELDQYYEQLVEESIADPSKFVWHQVCRGGNTIIRERVDLYPKLWAKGKELQRLVYMA